MEEPVALDGAMLYHSDSPRRRGAPLEVASNPSTSSKTFQVEADDPKRLPSRPNRPHISPLAQGTCRKKSFQDFHCRSINQLIVI
jgi:hypothetical protein